MLILVTFGEDSQSKEELAEGLRESLSRRQEARQES